MEHFIIDNNSVPLIDEDEKESTVQGDQLDFVPKKSPHISRSRTTMSTGSNESASPSRKAHKSKSRIPYNQLHSRPRKYISGKQDSFNEYSIAPLPNEKSISENVLAPLPYRKSLSESVLAPLPDGKPIPDSSENSQEGKPRYRSISAESVYFRNFELKNATPLPSGKSEGTEEKARYNFLSAVSVHIRAFESTIRESRLVFFVSRISMSSLVTLGMFSMLFLIWACDFEEPIVRIKKAMGNVFNDRFRPKL
ncbi:uncharacterized protein LOC27207109 [Drosophila simulans]|uniref:Uncharacterized protein n=1 Tax=Drosophila simulans TaxID=7240 RepID=A0A0J9QW78_DROSI|nr:uncharacterized protein LOC27207109 [Drosophila simulans]KMY88296.1 uncharacterized protein Dsimw501_GD27259 [Drosophila simulans]